MNRKSQAKNWIIVIIFLIFVGFVVFKTITANEPLNLEVQPCYLGLCMTGDYLKIRVCLHGTEDKTVNVEIYSSALVNDTHTVPVNYVSCKEDISLPLENTLKNEDYPITIRVPPVTDPGFFLQLKRLFTSKVLDKEIQELKNYKRD